MAASNGKLKELWGRQFRIVKNGLDESDVFSFIGKLIEENRELAGKLEHVSSLRRLAERAVVQAAKEAARIKKEAEEDARGRATAVVAEAEHQGRANAEMLIAQAEKDALARISAAEQEARRIAEEAELAAAAQVDRILDEAQLEPREQAARIIAQATQEANAQADKIVAEAGDAARALAESIVAEAQRQAEVTAQQRVSAAEDQARSILTEVEEKVRALQAPAVAEAETMIAEARQSIQAAQEKAREILSLAEEEAQSIRSRAEDEATAFIEELKRKADHAAEVRLAKAEEEGRKIIEESIKTARLEAERITEEAEEAAYGGQAFEESDLRTKFEVLLDLLVSSSLGSRERPRPPVRQPERGKIEAPRMSEPEEDEYEEDSSADLFHGPVELDFPPPLNSGRVLKIHKALAKLPHLRVLDLEGSSRGGIRIKAYVHGHVPLLDVLREMPDVEKVSNGVRASRSGSSRDGGKPGPRRIVVATRR